MDDNKALTIVSTLANGVNPLTGEVFASDSPYQSPDIVRALFAAARALSRDNTQPAASNVGTNKGRGAAPANVGKPWSSEEDERLIAEFDRGRSPRELAAGHGRTLAGIEARLEKLGKLTAQQRVTANRYGGDRQAQSQSR